MYLSARPLRANVFDITLKVQTPEKIVESINEPDMAVVIVMDISNTMKKAFGNSTRYKAAMDSAEQFLDKFVKSSSLGVSKIGYVAFNTDAHKIFGLQSCTNETQAKKLKNTMRTETEKIINATGYGDAHRRFTNIEAGLAMGQDMLKKEDNKHKFIIFLSDGFPTTYMSDTTNYLGYDPYDTTGRFYDHVLNKPCSNGTSYSDEAAIRAKKMAMKIKAENTTIFSIGVDIGGQTIQQYITQSEKEKGFSVVDRTGTNYEIGDATSTEAYKSWLRDKIGSGHYYDSTNTTGLKNAYDQIFTEIKSTIATASQADWVASDPIPTVGENIDAVEFIGLYDKTPKLAGDSLKGAKGEGTESTATFDPSKYAISWDLKNSGYQKTTDGNTTTYTYQLTYRVRLKNEKSGFEEGKIYQTNDRTTLQYRVVETKDGTVTISEPKTIDFPIPSVHGYLGELKFTKKDNRGKALSGAEFTLTHDANCSVCRGDGTAVKEVTAQIAISDENGNVSFTNIPSGHIYTLEETKVPAGYSKTGETYQVQVAYNVVTVTVSKNGKTQDWTGVIENYTGYELPNTGGAGTKTYTAGGLLLMMAAGGYLLYRVRTRGREE